MNDNVRNSATFLSTTLRKRKRKDSILNIPHEEDQDHITILKEYDLTIYKCNFCHKKIKSKQGIEAHLVCKTGIQPYNCRFCGERFSFKSERNWHTRVHNSANLFKCHICYKPFYSANTMTDHLNSHAGLKPYSCKVCNESFSSNIVFKSHMKNHPVDQTEPHTFQRGHFPITILTEKDGKRYECNVCRRKFEKEFNIMFHLASKTGVKHFNCELCGKEFLTSRAFEFHLQKVHSDGCHFKCKICGLGLPQQDSLVDHINRHSSGLMRYTCQTCNLGFSFKNGLNAHMFMHAKEQPFACSTCDKRYVLRKDLSIHMKSHSATPHACHICGQSFSNKHNLGRHLRIHIRKEQMLKKDDYGYPTLQHQSYNRKIPDEISQPQPPNEIEMDSIRSSVLDYQTSEADNLDAEFGELGDLFDSTHWNDNQSGSRTRELECSLVGDKDQEQQPEAFVYTSFEEVEKLLTTPPSARSSGNQ